jgi:transposase-like protein
MKNVEVDTIVVFKLPEVLRILLLDAKHFLIHKKAYTLYVGFDPIRKKPLCWILLPKHESRVGYDRILSLLRMKGMNIEAIVSDSYGGIKTSVVDWYPKAVHQQCAAHILMHAFRWMKGRRLIRTTYGRKLWKVITKIVLGYSDERKARSYLLRNKKKHPLHTKTWKILERNLNGIYQFTKRPDLPIPRTSNQIENFMGQLEQRLKTFRSNKSPQSLAKIVTALIRIKYKRPTN